MAQQVLSAVRVRGGNEVTLRMSPNLQRLEIQVLGDLELLEFAAHFRSLMADADSPDALPVPTGTTRAARLVREAVLRAQGKWHPPYMDEEICHCRLVPTDRVWDAIRQGARTGSEVSHMTSATTACGSCGPDVRALIEYYSG